MGSDRCTPYDMPDYLQRQVALEHESLIHDVRAVVGALTNVADRLLAERVGQFDIGDVIAQKVLALRDTLDQYADDLEIESK